MFLKCGELGVKFLPRINLVFSLSLCFLSWQHFFNPIPVTLDISVDPKIRFLYNLMNLNWTILIPNHVILGYIQNMKYERTKCFWGLMNRFRNFPYPIYRILKKTNNRGYHHNHHHHFPSGLEFLLVLQPIQFCQICSVNNYFKICLYHKSYDRMWQWKQGFMLKVYLFYYSCPAKGIKVHSTF